MRKHILSEDEDASRIYCVKHSEFTNAVQAVFGTYGSSLVRDLVLTDVGSRTAEDALAGGVAPRQVWAAICRAKDIDPLLWLEIRDTRKQRK